MYETIFRNVTTAYNETQPCNPYRIRTRCCAGRDYEADGGQSRSDTEGKQVNEKKRPPRRREEKEEE
jgi:hypothetical protein